MTTEAEHVDEGTKRKKVKRVDRLVHEAELQRLQAELMAAQTWVKETGARVLVIFEGRDAAGKGSAIKRVTEYLNPRIARVEALPVPSERERGQWVLPAVHSTPAHEGRDRAVRPLAVQSSRRRARHGVLHARGVPALNDPMRRWKLWAATTCGRQSRSFATFPTMPRRGRSRLTLRYRPR